MSLAELARIPLSGLSSDVTTLAVTSPHVVSHVTCVTR